MKKLKTIKRFIAYLMVASLFVSTPQLVSAALPPGPDADINVDDIIIITPYQDWDFTIRSAPEPVTLQMEYDSISLMAECENGATDILTCHVVDLTNEGIFNSTFDFVADGSVTTIFCEFPPGRYRVYFTGDTNILKTYGCISFGKYT